MKPDKLKKAAIRISITGAVLAGLGLLTNLFTFFSLYQKAGEPECKSGSSCDIGGASAAVSIGKFLTFIGLGLVLIGMILLIYSLLREDKK
ncbi:MAG TPA: hypothetical protein VFS31_14815 [Chitinophagaceae bacterium]|nr:hypothetical protein [Chitinophagaceae bacterium]